MKKNHGQVAVIDRCDRYSSGSKRKTFEKCDKKTTSKAAPLAVRQVRNGVWYPQNALKRLFVSDIDIELDICNMWQKYSFWGIKNLSYVKFDYPFARSLLSVESLIPR